MEVERPDDEPAEAQNQGIDLPAVRVERVLQLELRLEGARASQCPGQECDSGEGVHFVSVVRPNSCWCEKDGSEEGERAEVGMDVGVAQKGS